MFDKIADFVYNNRKVILRYFAAALVCGIFRSFAETLLTALGMGGDGAGFTAWCLWACAFYPALSLWAFKSKLGGFYELRRIMIYIIVCAVLWVTRSLLMSLFYAFSANGAVAVALGGALNEILCVIAIFRVFKVKYNDGGTKK